MSKRRGPTGATRRRLRNALPDSLALHGDPWAIGLAAIVSTLHRLGVDNLRVFWWHPAIGKGERPPPGNVAVVWCIEVTDHDGTALCAGQCAVTAEHGIGIVEAGAECIKALMEIRSVTA